MNAIRVAPAVIPTLVAGAFLSAWIAGTWYAIPSFAWSTSDIPEPANVATVNLSVKGMRCRKSSQKLHGLLFDRTDDNRVEGYLRAILFPSTGAGRLELSYDPSRTNLAQVARAIGWNKKGLETSYKVILDLKVDLSSPEALLHSLALSLEHQNEELFHQCHAAGASKDINFAELSAAWKDLFLEDLMPAGEVDNKGRVQIHGLSVGDKIPLEDLAPEIGRFVLERRGESWRIKKANWAKLAESAF
jgi:hypothetical protein